jgi:hypothetical protein
MIFSGWLSSVLSHVEMSTVNSLQICRKGCIIASIYQDRQGVDPAIKIQLSNGDRDPTRKKTKNAG